MAEASKHEQSRDNECPICFELVDSMKVFPCGHESCLLCLRAFIKVKKICPQCRKSLKLPPDGVDGLPTKFFGLLTCHICQKEKDVSEFWWCSVCVMIFCSRCDVTEHRKLKHEIFDWNSQEPVRAVCEYLKELSSKQKSEEKSGKSPILTSFLGEVKESLVQKIVEIQSKGNSEEIPRIQTTMTTLKSKFGISETPDGLVLPKIDEKNSEKIGKVVEKALTLAGAPLDEPLDLNLAAEKFGGFGISPKEFAEYLWKNAQFGNDADSTVATPQEKFPSEKVERIWLADENTVLGCSRAKIFVWKIDQSSRQPEFYGEATAVQPEASVVASAVSETFLHTVSKCPGKLWLESRNLDGLEVQKRGWIASNEGIKKEDRHSFENVSICVSKPDSRVFVAFSPGQTMLNPMKDVRMPYIEIYHFFPFLCYDDVRNRVEVHVELEELAEIHVLNTCVIRCGNEGGHVLMLHYGIPAPMMSRMFQALMLVYIVNWEVSALKSIGLPLDEGPIRSMSCFYRDPDDNSEERGVVQIGAISKATQFYYFRPDDETVHLRMVEIKSDLPPWVNESLSLATNKKTVVLARLAQEGRGIEVADVELKYLNKKHKFDPEKFFGTSEEELAHRLEEMLNR